MVKRWASWCVVCLVLGSLFFLAGAAGAGGDGFTSGSPAPPLGRDQQVRQGDELTAVTDGRGVYNFRGLPAGTHRLWLDRTTLPPSLRTPEDTASAVLYINPGQTLVSPPTGKDVRFTAIYRKEDQTIAGVVFHDRNGNGLQDAGDLELSGVTVVDPTIHQYFIPFNDADLQDLFNRKALCQTGGQAVASTLNSFISLTAGSDGTIYYYDHWEDGYDPDPTIPGPTTEVGVLDAGATRTFNQVVDITQLGITLQYDGRDRITLFGEPASLVRSVYPDFTGGHDGVWLAGSWEVTEVADWGTSYIPIVGEDLNPAALDDYDFVGLEVMAVAPGTQVWYNGTMVATLGPGETYYVPGANDGAGGGGVDSNDVITATAPVQVQVLSGACGTYYSSRAYTLRPVDEWSNDYWAPVPGSDDGAGAGWCTIDLDGDTNDDRDTDIYVHNPHPYAITVTVAADTSLTNLVIPPQTTQSVLASTGWGDLPTVSAAHLFSSETFWAVSAVDSASAGVDGSYRNDWGYVLIPTDKLSSQVVLGWAPGNNNRPPTDNGNLAFVTAITDTVIYVDLNQDGFPDPFDMNGDGDADDLDVYGNPRFDEPTSAMGVPLSVGQVLRVGDPDDRDLIGARIYTLELDKKIAVAWGQDPCASTPIAPYLDLGYTTLPVPIPLLTKTDDLAVDTDMTGDITPGDVLTYTLTLENNGLGAMHNVILTDSLPYTYTDFVVGSLTVITPPLYSAVEYYNGPTDTWGYTPTPDAQGDDPVVWAFRIRWPSIGPGETAVVSFRVRLDDQIPPDVEEVTNTATVSSDETPPTKSQDPEDPTDPDTDTPVGQAILSMVKRTDPKVVQAGGLLTYTLVLSNTGTGVAINVEIADRLPPWLRYVPGTLGLTWPVAQELAYTYTVPYTYTFKGAYADDFDDAGGGGTTGYSGDDGSFPWTTDWQEYNDDGQPTGGEVRVNTGSGALTDPAYLRLGDDDDDDAGVSRGADLTEFVEPHLRYYVAGTGNGDADDLYSLIVNGTDVLLSEVYVGDYTLRDVDLSGYAGSLALLLQFEAGGGLETGEENRVDSVLLYERSPLRSGTQVLTITRQALTYTAQRNTDPLAYDALSRQMVITQGMRIPAGGIVTVTYRVRVAQPLTNSLVLTNTAVVSSSNALTSPIWADDPVTIQSGHTLTLTKRDSTDPIGLGEVLTYTIAYTVTGNEPAPGTVITDILPAELTFLACAGGMNCGETSPGSGVVVWQLGDLLPPGSGITQTGGLVTVTGRLDRLPPGDRLTNRATIDDDTDVPPGDDSEETLILDQGLRLTKERLSAETVGPQGTVRYQIVVHNIGRTPLSPTVTLTDTYDPAYLRFGDAVPSPDSVTPGQIVWNNVGPVAVGGRVTVTLTFTALQSTLGASTVNGAIVQSGNLTDSDEALVFIADPSLALDKRLTGHDQRRGVVTFTIVITNTGPTTLVVVPLTDTYDTAYLRYWRGTPSPDERGKGALSWSDLTLASPYGVGYDLSPGGLLTVTTVFSVVADITQTVNVAMTRNALDEHGTLANEAQDQVPLRNVSTAVELLYFRATPQPGAVLLEWATAVEVDNYGFELYRGESGAFARATLLAFLPGQGTGGGARYAFTDRVPVPGRRYWYWLVDVDTQGRRAIHPPLEVWVASQEAVHRLYLPIVLDR